MWATPQRSRCTRTLLCSPATFVVPCTTASVSAACSCQFVSAACASVAPRNAMTLNIRRSAPQRLPIAREYRKIRRCALTGRRLPRTCAGCLVAAMLAGCASLPALDARTASHAIEAPTASALRAAVDPLAARHADQSGIYPLKDGPGAFAARVALVNAAVSSIDVQYYIWHDDTTGSLMFDALRRAADRGVRVRLLLDDLTTRGGL